MTTNTATAESKLRRSPSLTGSTAEFYNWCAKGELRFQQCSACKTWRHPPRPMCANCGSREAAWVATSGKGKVHTWTIVHAALDTAFAPDVPFAAVIIALDDGPRMASWVTGVAPENLRLDMPVTVWFDKVSPELTLPKFKPV